MIEVKNTQIEYMSHSEDETYGLFVAEPLERGYGITLGNALSPRAAFVPCRVAP